LPIVQDAVDGASILAVISTLQQRAATFVSEDLDLALSNQSEAQNRVVPPTTTNAARYP
jgi:hypothetical protein